MNKAQSTEFAQKYLSDLLSFFEVNVEVAATTEDDVIELSVPSTELNSLLIGRNAETLRSLQYLVSTVLRNKEAEVWRVNIDIADYKKLRAEKVAKDARGWIEGVIKTGEVYTAHLNPADRRIVHQVATEFPTVRTFSEGEGFDRVLKIEKV